MRFQGKEDDVILNPHCVVLATDQSATLKRGKPSICIQGGNSISVVGKIPVHSHVAVYTVCSISGQVLNQGHMYTLYFFRDWIPKK